jgi:mono/diheme cytochrome c family protein
VKRALIVLAACGGATRPALVPATSTPLADATRVVAVTELGDATIVLAEDRALVLRGGALAATIPHRWRAGATIAALDGDGAWAVGVDDAGRLYRITLAGDLEDVTDRFRIAGVRAVAAAGTTTVFGLRDGVAVTGDGLHELRVELAAPEALAASKGRIALAGARGVAVWDLAAQRAQTYPVHARAVALADGRVAVATGDRVLVEELAPGHALRSLPLAATQLAAAGARLWILAGAPYALDGDTLHRAGMAVPAGTRLFGAPNGDAFLAAEGRVERISIDARDDDPAWRADVAPVFARVCAHCHLPGGDAGIDLSTAAAWRAEHAELVRRVLVTRTMPPAGTDLSPADRDALARWLTSPSAAGPSTAR